MAWTTTPLKTEPLSKDSFTWNITGLSASTTYAYRSYAVIDNLPYYGDTCYITTLPIPTALPMGKTGSADNITTTGMNIIDNCVTGNGGLPITEFGVLYSQNGSLTLVNNNTVGVYCKSTLGSIAINSGYAKTLSGLSPNTTTYFRAYAKNGNGFGYGNVYTQQTDALPVQKMVYLGNGKILSNTQSNACGCATLLVDGGLGGGSFTVNFALCARSSGGTDSVREMNSCSYYKCGGGSTEYSKVTSIYPDFTSNYSDDDSVGGSFDVSSQADLDDHIFFVKTHSNSSNIGNNNYNRATIELTSISNQSGGSFVLGEPASICISACSGNVIGGSAKVFVPSGLA